MQVFYYIMYIILLNLSSLYSCTAVGDFLLLLSSLVACFNCNKHVQKNYKLIFEPHDYFGEMMILFNQTKRYKHICK